MIRSLSFHTTLISLCCLWVTMHNAYAVSANQQSDKKGERLPMSSAFTPGVTTRRMSRERPVEWRGKEYSPKDAIPVLMAVIPDKAVDRELRLKALDQMITLSNQISGTAWVGGLISRYNAALDRDEKTRLLQCLTGSEDPSAFPVFTRVLEQETDRTIRLFAACGLAEWNVRRGVVELVDQLHPDEAIAAGEPNLTNEAMKAIQDFGYRKGWGLSHEEIWKRIDARSGLDQNQKIVLYISEVKKWFVENEHRFPEWKPGDPLPVVEDKPDETKKPADTP